VLIIVWLILFSHTIIFSQSLIRFNRTYPYINGGGSRVATSILLKDSSVYVLSGGNALHKSNTLYFSKHKQNGDTILQKSYRTDSIRYYIGLNNAAFFQHDSFIVAVGALVTNHNKGDAMIVKFKLNGDTVFIKSYGDTANYENLISCARLNNGDIVAVGEYKATASQQYYLVKFDSIGNFKWAKHWGSGYNHSLNHVSLAKDDNLILGGKFEEWDIQASAFLTRSTIIKTDTAGNIIWHHEYRKQNNLYGTYIISYPDSSTIAICTNDTSIYTGSRFSKYMNYFIKFDKYGNELLQKIQLDPLWYHPASPPILLTNGDFIICSSTEDTSLNANQIGAISKFDKNCNQLWFRPIYHNLTDFGFFYSGAVASDGSIYAAGSANNFDSPPKQEMWLVHVDSFGCVVGGCESVGINEIPNSNEQLIIYPNPTHSFFTINFSNDWNNAAIKVFNLTGQMIFEKQNQNGKQFSIDLSHQSAGIYFVEVQTATGIYRSKVVKE
jgi:co-chaperonin GroES (HSP10)